MTTPQQDVTMLFNLMAPAGTIRLRRNGQNFTGCTSLDKKALRRVIGRGYFHVSEYDSVLIQVSNEGYSLEEEYAED